MSDKGTAKPAASQRGQTGKKAIPANCAEHSNTPVAVEVVNDAKWRLMLLVFLSTNGGNPMPRDVNYD